MGRARNLSNLKPSATGLIETDDLASAAVTPVKLANAGAELGVRNRIINGDMRIDQRNAGASVNTGGAFPVDRFVVSRSGGAATFTSQRSSVAPEGFTNSLLYTVGTGAAPGAADFSGFSHAIEGINVADLGWGTASAKAVTLSFVVRSGVAGTYGVSIRNGDGTRSYVAQFTISAANTFEAKSITVPGDTSGTWSKDSGTGLTIFWDLGTGTNGSAASGSWLAGNFYGLTGGTKLIATSGATFYTTGVQLEVGSVATPFEHRGHGLELVLCQRYYERGVVPVTYLPINTGDYFLALMTPINFKATKRNSSYTMNYAGVQVYASGSPANYTGAMSTVNIGIDQCSLYLSTAVANNNGIAGGTWTCSNEL